MEGYRAQPSLCLFLAWHRATGGDAGGGRVTGEVCSVQHGIQLVSQGIKHGANVVQDVLGRRPCGATSRENLEMGRWVCSPLHSSAAEHCVPQG